VEALPDLSSASLGALSRFPSIGFIGTEKERQSFYFFRHNTAPQLSGFFEGEFWETLLLQAALQERSIRHATLALGSLHATSVQDNGLVEQSHTDGRTDDFALRNYSQAINILVEPPSQEGQRAIDVCLICCILFACLEVSRSSIPASFLLIVSRHCKAATAPLSHTFKVA
jgi:hypothetical protein